MQQQPSVNQSIQSVRGKKSPKGGKACCWITQATRTCLADCGAFALSPRNEDICALVIKHHTAGTVAVADLGVETWEAAKGKMQRGKVSCPRVLWAAELGSPPGCSDRSASGRGSAGSQTAGCDLPDTSSRFLVRVQTLHLCPLYFHFIALFKSNKNWPEAMTREKREGFQTLKSCYQIGEGKKRKWRQSHAFRHPNAKTFFTG